MDNLKTYSFWLRRFSPMFLARPRKVQITTFPFHNTSHLHKAFKSMGLSLHTECKHKHHNAHVILYMTVEMHCDVRALPLTSIVWQRIQALTGHMNEIDFPVQEHRRDIL